MKHSYTYSCITGGLINTANHFKLHMALPRLLKDIFLKEEVNFGNLVLGLSQIYIPESTS